MKINTMPPIWVGYDDIQDTWYKGCEGAIHDCSAREVQQWIKGQAALLGFKEEPVFLTLHATKEIYNSLLTIGMYYTTGDTPPITVDIVSKDGHIIEFNYHNNLLMWYHFSPEGSDMYPLFIKDQEPSVAWLEEQGTQMLTHWGWRSSHLRWFQWLTAYTTLVAEGNADMFNSILNTPQPSFLLETMVASRPEMMIPIATIIQQYYDTPSLQEDTLWIS